MTLEDREVAEKYGAFSRIQSSRSVEPTTALTAVPSRDALRNVAEDFVRSAVRQLGVLEGIHAHPVAGSQQDHFISNGNAGDAGDICQCQVHRDAADDGGIVFEIG